jgi:hypothetical protein
MASNYRNSNPMKAGIGHETSDQRHLICIDLVNAALRMDNWLFDPSTKTWYTPAEFKDQFERITAGNEKFLMQIQIRDPLDGLRAGKLRIQDMQIKLEDLTQKIISYYRNKR